MTTTTPGRYSKPTVVLHWLMLLLIVGAYTAIELHSYFPKGSAGRELLKVLHFSCGLTILALIGFRIAARLMGPEPAILPTPPIWQIHLARVVQIALYALMVLMPIGGWLILSGEGKAIPFWGLELPALVAKNKDFAEFVEELHELGGKAGYALIGLHTVAALYHHYFLKDNTLKRMLRG